jgi:hypothetical protein
MHSKKHLEKSEKLFHQMCKERHKIAKGEKEEEGDGKGKMGDGREDQEKMSENILKKYWLKTLLIWKEKPASRKRTHKGLQSCSTQRVHQDNQ